MRQTQEQFVIKELQENGFISRNYCLNLYDLGVRTNITRLASVISSLIKDAGWEIEGKWERNANGKDFVYRVVGMPFKKVLYRAVDPSVDCGFKEIVRFEKK